MIPSIDFLDVKRFFSDEDVLKGDYVGHPFRGNQWTDASGVSQGGAGSTPDDDRKAYEMRQAGKSWDSIARELGYANGGSVRRLAMRHEARLKQNLDPTLVIPPPVVPDKTEGETGTKLSDLADPYSIRSARRLLKEILPDGAVTTLQQMHQASGSSKEITTQELKFIENLEMVGALVSAAIDAQTEADMGEGTKEEAVARAKDVSNLETIVTRLNDDNRRHQQNAKDAITKMLQGTRKLSVARDSGVSEMTQESLDAATILASKAYEEWGGDESTAAYEFILAGGDIEDELDIDFASRDMANPPEQLEAGEQRSLRVLREMKNFNANDYLKLSRREKMLRSDAIELTRATKSIVYTLLRDLNSGERTLEQVQNMSADQIVDVQIKESISYGGGSSKPVLFQRDELRGVEQSLDEDGELSGNEIRIQHFGLLGAVARTGIVIDEVRRVFKDPKVALPLKYQSENVLKVPFQSNASINGNPPREIPAGATAKEIATYLKELQPSTSRSRDEFRNKATVKVLEAVGVKFSKVKDVPHTVINVGRGGYGGVGTPTVKPDVEKDYLETMQAVIPFLPKTLTDGSMASSMEPKFTGGGKLVIVAEAGSGVKRAHARNVGGGKVAVRDSRPERSRTGDIMRGDRSVMLHEIGHGIEYANPWVRYSEWMTWKQRAGNETLKGLASLTGNSNYRSDEKGIKNAWRNSYAGKSYGGETPRRSETFEIFTTGMQAIFVGDEIIDPKHRDVVLGILAASSVTK